jgi:hypothetical protein
VLRSPPSQRLTQQFLLKLNDLRQLIEEETPTPERPAYFGNYRGSRIAAYCMVAGGVDAFDMIPQELTGVRKMLIPCTIVVERVPTESFTSSRN